MEKIKNFKTFVKEDIDNDIIDNQYTGNIEDDTLINMKNLQEWEDLLDIDFKNENMEEDDELINIDNVKIGDIGDEEDDDRMMHKVSNNDINDMDITESSEFDNYKLKDIFSEEEIENEEDE